MEYRPDWLAQVEEEILEPDRCIVDPHHHFWKQSNWGRYLLDDLWTDTSAGHRVEKTVFLECGAEYLEDGAEPLRPTGETQFVEGFASASADGPPDAARVSGIVGHADLRLGAAVEEVLLAHLSASPERFRGVRHGANWDADISGTDDDPRLYLDPGFREGFAKLAPLKLSFDAVLFHPQIPQVADLARAFPNTTIILNHLGVPIRTGAYAAHLDQVMSEWRTHIDELSRCENVFIKVGGLGMPVNGFAWHERDVPPGSEELASAYRPWCLQAIEAFGPRRCMFESNFPVDKVSSSYVVLWNAFKRIAEDFSEDDKEALCRGSATRAYRL
jgi:predicted TIM-barrel fold metal-dependent hydrolase